MAHQFRNQQALETLQPTGFLVIDCFDEFLSIVKMNLKIGSVDCSDFFPEVNILYSG